MPLPWQHTFYHCQKMCLAHLHPKANICAKFHENWWKTEEVVRDARFSPHFCHNMPLPWQHTFYHCQKMCLAHLHPKANICAKFHENWWKTEEVVRDARFFPNFCHNMPLPWQHTFYHFQKMCLAHLHPKANICAKFHENWWKTEEVVRDARFFPNFCHNMPLPWQHTFYHCQKMCLAHLHPKANICAKFDENWWKTEEVVRDARFSPHFCHNMPLPWQHTFYHCQMFLSCTSTPQGKHLCQISWELVKNSGSSSRRKIFPIFAIICRYHGNTLSITVKKGVLHIYTPRQTSVPNFMRIGEKLRK